MRPLISIHTKGSSPPQPSLPTSGGLQNAYSKDEDDGEEDEAAPAELMLPGALASWPLLLLLLLLLLPLFVIAAAVLSSAVPMRVL